MAQLAAPAIPYRRAATREDEALFCVTCENPFDKGQRIQFTQHGKPLHTRCSRFYYAALTNYYNLSVFQLVKDLKISARTAYRVMKISRGEDA